MMEMEVASKRLRLALNSPKRGSAELIVAYPMIGQLACWIWSFPDTYPVASLVDEQQGYFNLQPALPSTGDIAVVRKINGRREIEMGLIGLEKVEKRFGTQGSTS